MNKLKRILRYDWPLHFLLILTNWLPDNVPFLKLRGWLASPFFGKCGEDLRLGRNLTFYNPSNIIMGDHIYIALGCWFMAGETISVGNEVMFGPYCVVVSSNHTLQGDSFRYGESSKKPINIGTGSWIAAHCTIIAGSTIGSGVLVAANSTVKGLLPDKCFVGGQPAKVIKSYD